MRTPNSNARAIRPATRTRRVKLDPIWRGSYKIAEPEKALLDWVYLQRQEGLPVALDELSLNPIDKKKLQKYALQYPNSVQRTVRELP